MAARSLRLAVPEAFVAVALLWAMPDRLVLAAPLIGLCAAVAIDLFDYFAELREGQYAMVVTGVAVLASYWFVVLIGPNSSTLSFGDALQWGAIGAGLPLFLAQRMLRRQVVGRPLVVLLIVGLLWLLIEFGF